MSASLHAALMPFPSPQGTQGALAAMVRTLRARGDDASLFVHPHGDATGSDLPIVRSPYMPLGKSLRSGPTLGRALLDAAAIPALARAARGRTLFAHNVEAGAAARLARLPYAYVAHTLMSRELSYYAEREQPVLETAGRALDRLAASAATALVGISPQLVRDLGERFARDARYLPIPWSVGEVADDAERLRAKTKRGFDERTCVIGYTGNLDRYQGVGLLLPTLAALHAKRPALLLLATESDSTSFVAEAARVGLADRVIVAPLANEAERREAHALSDVVLVPRTCEGGVPIKLLDALARGVPVVAANEATAGLPLRGAALVTRADPAGFAAACLLAASDASRVAFRDAGRRYLASHHGARAFLDAHDAIAATLLERAR